MPFRTAPLSPQRGQVRDSPTLRSTTATDLFSSVSVDSASAAFVCCTEVNRPAADNQS